MSNNQTDKEKLADSDRIEALKYLSQSHRLSLESRFKRELQVLYVTLLFIVLITAAVVQGSIEFQQYLYPPTLIPTLSNILKVTWCFFIVAGIIPIWYLINTASANDINQLWAQNAEDELTVITSCSRPQKKNPNRKTFIGEIIIILLFVSVAGWLISIHVINEGMSKLSGIKKQVDQDHLSSWFYLILYHNLKLVSLWTLSAILIRYKNTVKSREERRSWVFPNWRVFWPRNSWLRLIQRFSLIVLLLLSVVSFYLLMRIKSCRPSVPCMF